MSNKLTEEEIIVFVKDMFSTTIAREQLMSPTKDFVVNIYARFLLEFGVENVSQPDIIATQGMDNIDRYEANIILWNIYKSVANIVVNAGVPDMSFGDIVVPKRIRTNRILSALCLLYFKLTGIDQKFHQMESKCVDLPIRRSAVEQRIRELKKQIEEKSMYLSSNKSKTNDLAQELKKLAEIYEQKSKTSDELTEESKNLKTTILLEREKISEIDIDLSQLREEIQVLDQKIVKSPERIQADTSEKEEELENKRTEKKKLEKTYMELIRSVDYLKEGSKSLMPSLDTFTEAFKDMESTRSQCEKLYETKLSINSKEEKLKSLKVQIKEQEKSCNTLRQQIVNNEKQFQQQIQTMKQINAGIKKELELKTKNQSETQKSCLEERLRLETKLDALETQNKQFREQYELISKKHSDSVRNVQNLIKTRLNQIQDLKQNKRNKN